MMKYISGILVSQCSDRSCHHLLCCSLLVNISNRLLRIYINLGLTLSLWGCVWDCWAQLRCLALYFSLFRLKVVHFKSKVHISLWTAAGNLQRGPKEALWSLSGLGKRLADRLKWFKSHMIADPKRNIFQGSCRWFHCWTELRVRGFQCFQARFSFVLCWRTKHWW